MDYENLENQALLKKLKEMFRNWYSFLSVKELAFNKKLTAEIEAIENLLSGNSEFAQ